MTDAGPGPIARTVFDPGAIWVLPASFITQKLRFNERASAFIVSISASSGTLRFHSDVFRFPAVILNREFTLRAILGCP